MKTKKNAIVVCCTASWLPLAAATLHFCTQKGAVEIADFFVITYDITPTDSSKFHEFAAQSKFTANVHNIHPDNELRNINARRFSTATLLRLTLDAIIPKSYERVLYMDCDVLPLRPLNELFELNMNGKTIAAVEDYVSLPGVMNRLSDHPREIGMQVGSRYFNAGVILFDWPKILHNENLKRAAQIIMQAEKSGQNLPFLDQDVLNLEFENNWHPLPRKFNLMTFMEGRSNDEPVLRHFNSRNKPWGKTWIPGLGKYKRNFVEVFSGTTYASIVSDKFSRISLPEIQEYIIRKFAIDAGFRRLNIT